MPQQIEVDREELRIRTREPVVHTGQTAHFRYLRPQEYALWDDLVDASPQGSILCRSWLLTALDPDIRILGHFRGNQLVAGIPLHFERHFGVSVCRMPKLIHTLGVVMEPLQGRRIARASREEDILSAFARELSKLPIFVQSFHPTLTNWLPFMWNGFRETTYFGYAFENLANPESLWREMATSTRQTIRKAERMGVRIIQCDSDLVARVAEKSFLSRGNSLPYSPEYLRRFYTATLIQDAGKCFAAVDEREQVHATAFIAWDKRRAYYIVGGTDPALRTSGADSLLIWHLIHFAHERARSFDFCGSVVRSISTFFRHFGTQLIPYHRISKLPRLLYLLYP